MEPLTIRPDSDWWLLPFALISIAFLEMLIGTVFIKWTNGNLQKIYPTSIIPAGSHKKDCNAFGFYYDLTQQTHGNGFTEYNCDSWRGDVQTGNTRQKQSDNIRAQSSTQASWVLGPLLGVWQHIITLFTEDSLKGWMLLFFNILNWITFSLHFWYPCIFLL